MPMGCETYPCCRSYRLTKSMTQYCHSVELPQSSVPESPSILAKVWSTAPPPDDSLAQPVEERRVELRQVELRLAVLRHTGAGARPWLRRHAEVEAAARSL